MESREEPSLTERVLQWLRLEGLAGDGTPTDRVRTLARGNSLHAFILKEQDRLRSELSLEWDKTWGKVLDETKAQKNRAVIQASNAEDVATQQRQVAEHRLHAIEEALAYLSASDYAGARRRLSEVQ